MLGFWQLSLPVFVPVSLKCGLTLPSGLMYSISGLKNAVYSFVALLCSSISGIAGCCSFIWFSASALVACCC